MNRSGIFESLELRQLMSATLSNPNWGTVGETLLRLAPAAYADGLNTPAGTNRPSARAISNALFSQSTDILDQHNLSAFSYLWGQFIDHDLDLSNDGTQAMNISVPTGDPYFDPTSTGTQVIPLNRSQYTGGVSTPRQQFNAVTSYIDGSQIYGSDATRAAALRTFNGGLLKTSAGNMLAYNTFGLDNATAGGNPASYYISGDVRANENIELTAITTLFVREHNRLASLIHKQNPLFTDQQIYQQARKLVVAEIQNITYNEYLPSLLGSSNPIRAYQGFNASVNPDVSNEFSTAAFRFGHSQLPNDTEFLDNNGNDVHADVDLAGAFFNPSLIAETGIDPILKYIASDNSQANDLPAVDGLRNFLFGAPGQGGLDLIALDIQRGRDHGLADYNTTRVAMGLSRITSFSQITSNTTVQTQLKSMYGTVDNIDLFVGGEAEDHFAGSTLGPTFQRIIADQFTRTRDGDAAFYLRSLGSSDLQLVKSMTLANIIRDNTTTTNLQDDVFHFDVTISGQVFANPNRPGAPIAGIAGETVTLYDADNDILQTTTTAQEGRYSFDQVGLGQFHVTVTPLAGFTIATPTQAVTATRGEALVANFSETHITVAQPPPPPHSPFAPQNQRDRIVNPLLA